MIKLYSVYIFKNIISGKVYVGSTRDAKRRRKTHFSNLRTQKHKNRRLQKDFNRYGEASFEFIILTKAKSEDVALRFEQIFIDGFVETYNILPFAGKARGRVHIKATKDKMSEKGKSRMFKDWEIERLRTLQVGRKASEETKRKRADTMRRKRENGEINHHSSLKEYQVLAILKALDDGFDRSFLSEALGVSKSAIGHIAQGTTWLLTKEKYETRKREASA